MDDLLFEADLESLVDLSSPYEPGKGTAFGLDPPVIEALLPSASGLCVERISFCAHASGTHTECLLHIDPLIRADMRNTDAWKEGLVPCLVVRVDPVKLGESGDHYAKSIPVADDSELVISRAALQSALGKLHPQPHKEFMHSLLVLTSGVPAFFTNECIIWLVEQKTTRLLVDQVRFFCCFSIS